MSDKELNRLKLERTQLRRRFTADYNKLESLINAESVSVSEVELQFQVLGDKAERLFKLEGEVNEILFTLETDEDKLASEYDTSESYREKWVKICGKKQILHPPAGSASSDVSNSSSSKHALKKTYKLPKIEIEKFDGNIKNWISFWAQFRKIHEDESLDTEDKFQYLRQATLKDSPARELVDSFPASASNYSKAIDQLKARFGRDGLLIILYVRELLKLVLTRVSNDKTMTLRSLYDKLASQIRALESLNVTSEKYACILFPLVESALSENVLKEWERVRISLENKESDDNLMLKNLLNFLRQEVESEERMKLARDTFVTKSNEEAVNEIKPKKVCGKEKIATATGLVNVKKINNKKPCIFCEGSHSSADCFKVRDKRLEELQRIVKDKGACFSCLKIGHSHMRCRAILNCILCKGKHVPLVCPSRKLNKENHDELNLANTNSSTVLMQTLVVKVRGYVNDFARALIDTGSQRSYISKRLINKMKYEPVRQEKMVHALFGGVQTEPKQHQCYKIRVGSLDDKYLCNFDALDSDAICHAVPKATGGIWSEELREMGIILSDESEGPIDILIGADIAGKIMTGEKRILKNGLVALKTTLGWTVMGKVSNVLSGDLVNINLLCHESHVSDLWRLDIIGIEDPTLITSKKEEWRIVERQFRDSVKILDEGRYEVSLPWLYEHPKLPSNFAMARRRLENTVKKLENLQLKKEYEQVFLDWMQEGIIEEVTVKDWQKGHYLPHRAVIKEGSSTPLRPVFDASAKEKGHCSLNECLEKGINLIELIPNIIIRFRLGKIGVSADIKRAFLQISLQNEDRDFLRFLWIGNGDTLRIFRHRRVVFGVTCSPFQLMAVINFHLDRAEKNLESDTQTYSLDTVEKLRGSFYVDNCVTSLPSLQKAHEFQREAITIFEGGKFELRQWEYTGDESSSTTVSLLGIIWDKKKDVLKLNPALSRNEELQSLKVITRRKLLSLAQRVYDPLGFSAPVALIPKLLLQRSWNLKGTWDSELPEEIQKPFRAWVKEIAVLNKIEIPRWIHGEDNTNKSVHVFCDASQHAYATAIFLRCECSHGVKVHLLQARSRVAPIKKTTIPRLELLAATIGARLTTNIIEELGEVDRYYWTDSSTVLAWIRNEGPWSVFVENRVQEIRRLTSRYNWYHLPGRVNPADLPSRGCTSQQFLLSRWWEGPQWMQDPVDKWPKSPVEYNDEEINTEKRKTPVVTMPDTSIETDWYYKYFSSYKKLVRMVAWINRFLHNTRSSSRRGGELGVEEVLDAETTLLLLVQRESFPDEKKLKLQLNRDCHGLVRVRTQVFNREDTESFKYPVLLPSNHVVVSRLIEEVHKENGHAGGQTLVCLLRERYWILKSRKTVRSITTKCVVCRRQQAKHLDATPAALPIDRIKEAAAFEVVGIDYAGPLTLKEGEKAWLCLYTCAIYRAIHLELVTSLSTEVFLQALRRFIARRGRPSVIYSDNGLNFRGANNAFGQLNWANIETYCTTQRIKWIFNPPTAAWWGGWWERMVGVIKRSLRKVLGKASLGYEELVTILCDCEALANSRPLTYVSHRPEDLQPLTPAMFIQDIHFTGVPDCDKIDAKKLNARVNYRQRVREDLRKRFRVEYLGLLRGNSNKRSQQPFGIGDVVLVEGEGKRLDWPLAKIVELITGKDGVIRLVRVKTASGLLLRPVQRIYPLEVSSDVKDIPEDSEEPGSEVEEAPDSPRFLRSQILKSGRQTRVPRRLRD